MSTLVDQYAEWDIAVQEAEAELKRLKAEREKIGKKLLAKYADEDEQITLTGDEHSIRLSKKRELKFAKLPAEELHKKMGDDFYDAVTVKVSSLPDNLVETRITETRTIRTVY